MVQTELQPEVSSGAVTVAEEASELQALPQVAALPWGRVPGRRRRAHDSGDGGSSGRVPRAGHPRIRGMPGGCAAGGARVAAVFREAEARGSTRPEDVASGNLARSAEPDLGGDQWQPVVLACLRDADLPDRRRRWMPARNSPCSRGAPGS